MAENQIYYQVFIKGNSVIDVKKPANDDNPVIGCIQTNPPLNAGKVKREIVKQEGLSADLAAATLYLVAGDDTPAEDSQIIEGESGADQDHPIAVVFKGDPTA